MDLIQNFSKVVAPGGERLSSRALLPDFKFPVSGPVPIVAIDLEGTLAEHSEVIADEHIGIPLPYAIWALRTFKVNGWEVEIFAAKSGVDGIWRWVNKYAQGLIDRVSEGRVNRRGPDLKGLPKSIVDLFIDDRGEYWFGRRLDWIEIMVRLNTKGFLGKGLVTLEESEEGYHDMITLCEEHLFRDIVEDLRDGLDGQWDMQEDLIKEVEKFVASRKNSKAKVDILTRAKSAGRLLECVLKSMVRDRFDPVGCILLAQQDREVELDQVSPLSEGHDGEVG